MSPRTKKKNSVKTSSPRNKQRTGQERSPKSEDYIRKASEKQGLTYETTNSIIAKIKGDASSFRYENLQLEDVPGNVVISSLQPEKQTVPHSLHNLSMKDIEGLTVKDFARATRHTNDPRQLMLGLNIMGQLEEEFQRRIKEYLKEHHGVEAKGKVRLNAVISLYESAKTGPKYYGYVQASFDNRTTKLYRLTDEEVGEELSRRQISLPSATLA